MEPQANLIAVAVAALVPMIMGFIYYHPKVMGNAWMKANGFTLESIGTGPKPVLYLVALAFSFLLSFRLCIDVIAPGQDVAPDGHSYITFQHGLAHGAINTIFLLLPVLGTISIFEKRGWNWLFVNLAYWGVTLMIMQGILSAWR
ncbi:MAG: DUF1761 domain-containing protein [Saprospiraceae bacterium]|nr:DUF1761 domain-containing protein [Saprospiraceae bacterium]MBK8449222.1 DUF1761 domain-containing protein [Saprospiraceae bacterium]MBK9222128.1 DUF1761 domain-containing protein [Saprospiraceae bacterium]MBK9720962.1 DUF1761 domain-containing protein [Saprospiraceae bacterium]